MSVDTNLTWVKLIAGDPSKFPFSVVDRNGVPLSWIDDQGNPGGLLAPSASLGANSLTSLLIGPALVVNVETTVLTSGVVSVPSGTHKLALTAKTTVVLGADNSAFRLRIRKGVGTGGTLLGSGAVATSIVGGQQETSVDFEMDTVTGPSTVQYTMTVVVADGTAASLAAGNVLQVQVVD